MDDDDEDDVVRTGFARGNQNLNPLGLGWSRQISSGWTDQKMLLLITRGVSDQQDVLLTIKLLR